MSPSVKEATSFCQSSLWHLCWGWMFCWEWMWCPLFFLGCSLQLQPSNCCSDQIWFCHYGLCPQLPLLLFVLWPFTAVNTTWCSLCTSASCSVPSAFSVYLCGIDSSSRWWSFSVVQKVLGGKKNPGSFSPETSRWDYSWGFLRSDYLTIVFRLVYF